VRLWDAATGALLQIFRVEGRITALKFSGDGSYLITNLGPLYIKSIGGNNPHDTPLENIKICVQDKRWITFHGKKALWLPSEYRPVCSAVKCSTLALGHASGLITFLYFL
jgi:WD40 repeat protein